MKRYNWEQDQIAHMKVKQCSLVALLLFFKGAPMDRLSITIGR